MSGLGSSPQDPGSFVIDSRLRQVPRAGMLHVCGRERQSPLPRPGPVYTPLITDNDLFTADILSSLDSLLDSQ